MAFDLLMFGLMLLLVFEDIGSKIISLLTQSSKFWVKELLSPLSLVKLSDVFCDKVVWNSLILDICGIPHKVFNGIFSIEVWSWGNGLGLISFN